MEYAGVFFFNSDRKITYLLDPKRTKIYHKYRIISKVTDLKIRGITSLIYTLISTFQAKEYGPLHYIIDTFFKKTRMILLKSKNTIIMLG